jgi:hypothetical protein
MPGELGNEDEQQGVGYYEHRTAPDDDPNTNPPGTIEDMRKKLPNRSVMKVLRNYSEQQVRMQDSKEVV